MAQEDKGLVSRVGPIEIDWPRSAGFFGALAAATAVGLIEPPLGLFIAAVPFIKMLDRPQLPVLPRFISQVLDGMAKPVGGDAEGTIRFSGRPHPSAPGANSSRHERGRAADRADGGPASVDAKPGSRSTTSGRQRTAR